MYHNKTKNIRELKNIDFFGGLLVTFDKYVFCCFFFCWEILLITFEKLL